MAFPFSIRDAHAPSQASGAFLRRAVASVQARAHRRAWQLFEAAKPAVQAMRQGAPAAHLFVFGCQRSGTTHLERLFRSDPRSTVYGEFSALSVAPTKTVWRPLPEVAGILGSSRGSYTVARSLLFSHRASQALDAVAPSVAVWVFRDAGSVVDSMIRKWGPEFRAISERVEAGADGAWELRLLWDEIEAAADAGGSAGRGSEQWTRDVYALYWSRRNAAFFQNGLTQDPRVALVDYDDLVARPRSVVEATLRRAGLSPMGLCFPQRPWAAVGRRKPVEISPTIQAECDRLYRELRHAASGCR